MKLLILSDSHSSLRAMRACIAHFLPDAVVHLGDYYGDGETIAEENPGIPFYRVPGNCDSARCLPWIPSILVERIGGALLYMTHGHRHGVKLGDSRLLCDARAAGADAVLYGHTHTPVCRREADGLWVLNPGSCGFSGTAGLMEIENGVIRNCRIIKPAEWEAQI